MSRAPGHMVSNKDWQGKLQQVTCPKAKHLNDRAISYHSTLHLIEVKKKSDIKIK